MNKRPTITLFGKGALGGALRDIFLKNGFVIRSIWRKEKGEVFNDSTEDFEISETTFPTNSTEVGDIIFLCVPDQKISGISERLSNLDIEWSEKHVIHTSGSLPVSRLDSLAKKGAKTAAMHPIQTFQSGDDKTRFEQIYVSLTGDQFTVEWLRKVVELIGAKELLITDHQKQAIHLAAVFASNYLVVLLKAAEEILERADLDHSVEILKPLIDQTLLNIFDQGASHSLTGPIKRGDTTTLNSHLERLKDLNEDIYRVLGLKAVEIARNQSGLSNNSIELLTDILKRNSS